MKNAPAFRPGILPGRRVNGYKADSSRYFAGIFRPCKRGLSVQGGIQGFSQRVLVILDGRRPRQNHPLGQDSCDSNTGLGDGSKTLMGTISFATFLNRNDGCSPPVPRKQPLVPGTIDDVQKSLSSAQAKMANHLTVNTTGIRRFI
ncbi:hypothetical protein TNCV_2351811 [Trichonephila clavipes]|nr:hypothetical protein TNCV_2351811 [Trichonephila clavipes]